jgi:pre-mRNA-splicing factor 18
VTACEEGNFVLAHEWYIKTAIGNSAWPIGVTMVGIHERSGREKLTKVAHVMNNELSRKYLTSLKRLMSFAQSQATDVAPSRKVG